MNGWMGGCLDMSTETWLRCRTSCDVARLPLIAAIDHLWQNSTLLFGAIALCTTKEDDLTNENDLINEDNIKK